MASVKAPQGECLSAFTTTSAHDREQDDHDREHRHHRSATPRAGHLVARDLGRASARRGAARKNRDHEVLHAAAEHPRPPPARASPAGRPNWAASVGAHERSRARRSPRSGDPVRPTCWWGRSRGRPSRPLGRCRPRGVEGQHARGDERGVEAVGKPGTCARRDHEEEPVHRLAARPARSRRALPHPRAPTPAK